MIAPDSRWLNDAQRARAGQVADWALAGKGLAWNGPASLFIGLWALKHGLWRAFFRLMWSTKWTYLLCVAIVPLLFLRAPLAWVLIFAHVSYMCGRYGTELHYIVKGGEATPSERSWDLATWVAGWYLMAWGILSLFAAISIEQWHSIFFPIVLLVVAVSVLLCSSRALVVALVCMAVYALAVLIGPVFPRIWGFFVGPPDVITSFALLAFFATILTHAAKKM